MKERVALVGLRLSSVPQWEVEDHLDELARLAESAGAEVAGRHVQARNRPTPDCFIGSGRAVQIAEESKKAGVSTLIFDDELSPAQVRNLEKLTELKVIDRTELILDIFARHAQTHESRIQVELAQLNYLLPRLTGHGVLLSRLGGGIGTRGPGETKLETDRRVIRRRMSDLKNKLRKIGKTRELHRRGRRGVPKAALVGYTNVGKSSLLNALTGAGALAQDQLFATLDSTTRRLDLEGEGKILLTDTVGFIRKFPPHLAASFRSTLEEALDADLILHVADASHPHFREQMAVVEGILEELGAASLPHLLVLNKSDLLDGAQEGLVRENAILCSARTGEGMHALRSALLNFIIHYTEKSA